MTTLDSPARPLRGWEAAGDGRARRTILVALAMFAGPWLWWGTRIAEDHGLVGWHLPQGLALWTITPMLVTAVLLAGGPVALADLGRRIVRWRVRGPVWVAALLTPLAIAGVAAAIVTLLGGHVRVGEQISFPAALVYLGYGTGLFLLTEEAGWRGVLLARLQARLSPLSASLLVGVVWAVWHLPLLVSRGEGDPVRSLVPFSLLVIATSVLLGALFNAAQGSVLVAAFFHASFDATYSYFGVVGSGRAMLWATVAVTGLAAVALAHLTRSTSPRGTLDPRCSAHPVHEHRSEPDMTSEETTTRTLHRGEGRIAYETWGEGPLVVCVPGMGELRSSYRHNVHALSGAGLRVAAMDLRGHGGSDATFGEYDDVAAATDTIALVEVLGGGPAVLVGSSMGAGAAVWAAAERPDLVAGLVLVGPFVRDAPMNPVMAWAFRLAMSGFWAPAVWHRFQSSLYPRHRPADFVQHRAAIRASMRRPGYAKAFTATTRTSHGPVEARLSEVRVPVLVVMGTSDPDFRDPGAEADWIVGHLPDAERLLVEGAGHYPHAEVPEIVNPALGEFIGRVLPRTSGRG